MSGGRQPGEGRPGDETRDYTPPSADSRHGERVDERTAPQPPDDDATRVGMPVPPMPPRPPEPTAPPGSYSSRAAPTDYGAPPPYATGPPYTPPRPYDGAPNEYSRAPYERDYPARRRGGPPAVLLALLALGLLLLIALGALAALGIGPFGPDAGPATGVASPTPADGDAPVPGLSPTSMPAETPVGPPTSPPEPTTPEPTAAARPTVPAPPTPGSPTPSTPADPGAVLLSHIPDDLRAECLPVELSDALAAASCAADDGEIVATYFLYGDRELMQQTYDGFVVLSGVERDSGRCNKEETWPAEGFYRVRGRQVGRVLCTTVDEGPIIYWTDERLSILAVAAGTPDEEDDLFDFWRQKAGPLP